MIGRGWALTALSLAVVVVSAPHAQATRRASIQTLDGPRSYVAPVIPPARLSAAGDLLKTVYVPRPASGGIGIGVELAPNGRVIYTNNNECAVYFTDLDGNDLGSLPLIDDGSGIFSCPSFGPNAIAFNYADGYLYAGGWEGSTIWQIDLNTGVTVRLKDNAANGLAYFIDGFAYDTVDGSYWMSGDSQCQVFHFDASGNPHPDGRDFDGCLVTGGETNSGLAVAADGQLWYGASASGRIYRLDMSTNPPTDLGVFSSPGGRDEDMDCGPPFTKGDGTVVATLLSKDAYADFFVVIEVDGAIGPGPPDAEAIAPPAVCPAELFTLDGSGTIPCSGGTPEYRWLDDQGTELCPWSLMPNCDTSAVVDTTYTLEVRCLAGPCALPSVDSAQVTVRVAGCNLAVVYGEVAARWVTVGAAPVAAFSWSTLTEDGTRAFVVERAASSSGPFLAIDGGTVAATGTGSSYEVADRAAVAGTRFYRVTERTTAGAGDISPVVLLEPLASQETGSGSGRRGRRSAVR